MSFDCIAFLGLCTISILSPLPRHCRREADLMRGSQSQSSWMQAMAIEQLLARQRAGHCIGSQVTRRRAAKKKMMQRRVHPCGMQSQGQMTASQKASMARRAAMANERIPYLPKLESTNAIQLVMKPCQASCLLQPFLVKRASKLVACARCEGCRGRVARKKLSDGPPIKASWLLLFGYGWRATVPAGVLFRHFLMRTWKGRKAFSW